MPGMQQRPPRTIGLSLAILASVLLFTALPLMQVAVFSIVQFRFSKAALPVDADELPTTALAAGGRLGEVTDSGLILQVVLGLGYLPLSIMAWRGRPARVRIVIMGAVVLLTLFTAGAAVAALASTARIVEGVDSGRDAARALLLSRTALSAVIALYVVWYMNRGPARAFYRGYYLKTPEEPPAREHN